MKGGWYDHSADIVNDKTGQSVARIDRKLLSGRDLVFGQQTYAVVVAPGVDAALIAALCICFDEKNNEERGDWTKCNLKIYDGDESFSVMILEYNINIP